MNILEDEDIPQHCLYVYCADHIATDASVYSPSRQNMCPCDSKPLNHNSCRPRAQSCFRPGRSTVDVTFVIRHLQEKCTDHNIYPYAVFIDFTKAFDKVNRDL